MRGRTLATSLEGYFGCDKRVEGRGNEDPRVHFVVEGMVARGAEEDEVFVRVEIGKLDSTAALELRKLRRKSVVKEFWVVE